MWEINSKSMLSREGFVFIEYMHVSINTFEICNDYIFQFILCNTSYIFFSFFKLLAHDLTLILHYKLKFTLLEQYC